MSLGGFIQSNNIIYTLGTTVDSVKDQIQECKEELDEFFYVSGSLVKTPIHSFTILQNTLADWIPTILPFNLFSEPLTCDGYKYLQQLIIPFNTYSLIQSNITINPFRNPYQTFNNYECLIEIHCPQEQERERERLNPRSGERTEFILSNIYLGRTTSVGQDHFVQY
jgi:hypothetical protein